MSNVCPISDGECAKLSENLRGTSGVYDQTYIEDLPIDSVDDVLEWLEEHIFRCDCCGWWCENDELTESDDTDQICEDCRDEHHS